MWDRFTSIINVQPVGFPTLHTAEAPVKQGEVSVAGAWKARVGAESQQEPRGGVPVGQGGRLPVGLR